MGIVLQVLVIAEFISNDDLPLNMEHYSVELKFIDLSSKIQFGVPTVSLPGAGAASAFLDTFSILFTELIPTTSGKKYFITKSSICTFLNI